MSGIRVLAFGAWDRGDGYPRAEGLLEGLRRRGAQVACRRFELPFQGAGKRRLLTAPWRWPGLWLAMRRMRRHAQDLLLRAVADERPDVVLVPYPGHLVVPWVRRVWRGPLVLDLFLSAYETAVVDRGLYPPRSLRARLMRRIDVAAARCADRVLLDTEAGADYVADLVGLPRGRFAAVPVSDPREAGAPPAYLPPGKGQKLDVLFFGTGVPLHGLSHLLDAMESCEGVRLTLIGGTAADRDRAARLPGHKVRVLDPFVPDAELRAWLARSHVVAGVFGTSPKAGRVVPLKVMLALGAGRPVVTARTPAVEAVLRPAECLLVPPGDAPALAAVLQGLADDPAQLPELARAARGAYERAFSLARVGDRLLEVCAGLGVAAGAPVSPPVAVPCPVEAT